MLYIFLYGKIQEGDFMNLHQLKYFSDTAKSENLTKTAQKHNVPTSAVSSSIKKLEEELGVTLFDRTANSISLNQKGEIFANEISFAFDRIDNVIKRIAVCEKENTEIKILLRARPKWVAEIIGEFLLQNPNVNFIVSNDYSLKNFEDFDIIIDELSDKYRSWCNFLLSTEIICVKASASSELVGKELCFKNISDQPFVLPCIGNGMRDRYEKICKQLGVSPNVLIECNDRQILQYYVQSGAALTIGAHRALKDNTQNLISPLNVFDFNEVQNVFVFYKDTNIQNPVIKEFCDLLYKKRFIL